MLSRFEICGLVEEDFKNVTKLETAVVLTNSDFLIKILGAPAIHYCFCTLKERLASKVSNVVFNVADSLPAFYFAVKLNYCIEHSFTSTTAASIANRYAKGILWKKETKGI